MSDGDGQATKSICGIIMPISASDDFHTKEHWSAVMDIIIEAIDLAGLIGVPVWENSDADIIQSKILQNLFENEIVVCDISTKNPNVMLEFGMRLSTKKPTIVIAEEGTSLPFDTNVIHTEFYDKNLAYGRMKPFIEKVSALIKNNFEIARRGDYKSYLETFSFVRIQPETVNISETQVIESKIDDLRNIVRKLENRFSDGPEDGSDWAFKVPGVMVLPSKYENSAPYVEHFIPKFRPKGASEMAAGRRVHHTKFGFGTIAEVDGDKLEIDFDKVGRKRCMDSFVRLINQSEDPM